MVYDTTVGFVMGIIEGIFSGGIIGLYLVHVGLFPGLSAIAGWMAMGALGWRRIGFHRDSLHDCSPYPDVFAVRELLVDWWRAMTVDRGFPVIVLLGVSFGVPYVVSVGSPSVVRVGHGGVWVVVATVFLADEVYGWLASSTV